MRPNDSQPNGDDSLSSERFLNGGFGSSIVSSVPSIFFNPNACSPANTYSSPSLSANHSSLRVDTPDSSQREKVIMLREGDFKWSIIELLKETDKYLQCEIKNNTPEQKKIAITTLRESLTQILTEDSYRLKFELIKSTYEWVNSCLQNPSQKIIIKGFFRHRVKDILNEVKDLLEPIITRASIITAKPSR